MVDVDHHEIEKLEIAIDVAVTADADAFLAALQADTGIMTRLDIAAWRERCVEWKQRFAIRNEMSFAASGPVSHFQFVNELSEAVPSDTLITTGSSGLALEVFYTVFRNKPGQRIFLTSGLGSMGYGLPAAIGACFANGCRPMVAVESDGSLQLNIQELATLRAFNLPICLIVMNNGGYASIRNTMRNYFDGRYVGTGPEAGLWLPDLQDIAATYQIPFLRISDVQELKAALAEAMRLPRPLLVDMRLLNNESLAPKVAALPQADGSMISMPMEDMSPLLSLEQLQAEMLIPLTPASLRCVRDV